MIGGARTVIVSDPSPSRRKVAAELGAGVTVDPTGEDLAAVVADATGGFGADVAVVCIGRPQLVNDGLNLVGKRGRVSVFAGLADKGWAEVEANLIHYKEISLLGAANSGRADYERAVALISSGRIDTGPDGDAPLPPRQGRRGDRVRGRRRGHQDRRPPDEWQASEKEAQRWLTTGS